MKKRETPQKLDGIGETKTSPRIIEIPAGRERPEIAQARYAAFLAIEEAESKATIEQWNCDREAWNAKPETERNNINRQRKTDGETPIEWPLQPLVWSHSKRRCELARRACGMTKEQRRGLGVEFGQKIPVIDSGEHQDVQHMLRAWDIAEGSRTQQRRIDRTRRLAQMIMARRESAAEAGGFELKEHYPATFGPEGGEWAEWGKTRWDSLSEVEREAERSTKWEPVERLLPVFYEFARQSPKVLQWAIQARITQKWTQRVIVRRGERADDSPSNEGWPMHPLEEQEGKFADAMRRRIGGFAGGLQALAKFLVHDVPYALIPLLDRKWATDSALRCNESHPFSGPWFSDAGEVTDPWAAKLVTRDRLRLARIEEATKKVLVSHSELLRFGDPAAERHQGQQVLSICSASMKATVVKDRVATASVHTEGNSQFDYALAATTEAHLLGRRDDRTILPQRVIADDGSEVLTIRVVWKDTLDRELCGDFDKLLKSLRPRKKGAAGQPPNCWPAKDHPERKERRGEKDSNAEAALAALIKVRQRRAAIIKQREAINRVKKAKAVWDECQKPGKATNSERAAREKAFAKRRQEESDAKQRTKDCAVTGKTMALATRRFQQITGDDSPPWWKARKCA